MPGNTIADPNGLWPDAERRSRKTMHPIRLVMLSYCIIASTLCCLAQDVASMPPLTNKEIVEMVKGDLSPDVIIAKIKASPCQFDTRPSILAELKRSDVSSSVLKAMIEASVVPAQANRVCTTGGDVYTRNDVTQSAFITSRSKPSYTKAARKHGIVGEVVLCAVLTAKGTVDKIDVVKGLPDGLTEQAIKAARKIKFKPAMIGDRAVSLLVEISFDFDLN